MQNKLTLIVIIIIITAITSVNSVLTLTLIQYKETNKSKN